MRLHPIIPVGAETLADIDKASVAPLTLRQEAFALAYVRTRNRGLAFREAYDVDGDAADIPVNRLSVRAQQIWNVPKVQARISELLSASAASTVVDAARLLQTDLEIVAGDEHEIMALLHRNCRYCHGVDHQYRWIDEDEYTAACVQAIEAKKIPPTADGGFGFNEGTEPHPECPRCGGNGSVNPWFADTSKLSGPSRALFRGVKIGANGQIEILLHDKDKAKERIWRALGVVDTKMILERMTAPAKGETIDALPENVSADTVAREYARLIG